jgi:hypothetical protein
MNVQAPFSNWEDIIRGYDSKNEVKSEPYIPEVKTISVTPWELSLAHQREINMRAYENRMQRRPKKRARRSAPKPAPKQRIIRSSIVSVRIDRDKKR